MSDFNITLLIIAVFIILFMTLGLIRGALMEKSNRINRILAIIEKTVDRPLSYVLERILFTVTGPTLGPGPEEKK